MPFGFDMVVLGVWVSGVSEVSGVSGVSGISGVSGMSEVSRDASGSVISRI